MLNPSLRDIATVSYITVTDVNLGSTFSDGAIIAVDGDNQRLVMVARDYVLNALKSSE